MELQFLFIFIFFTEICVIVESIESDTKSSLTFVIDNTYSMTDDIEEVKMGANAIFDTVLKTNNSLIEDFVLVTFRDPDFKLNIITRDKDAFKNAFNDDMLIGNWDCPEYSLSGIELALQNSREGSFLFVFTDASAKDYHKYDDVEALALKKQCKIVFVLTDICSTKSDPDYLVYHKIAKVTDGEVFHLKSQEIRQILKYVENIVESRKNLITSKHFPAGYGNIINVVVDGDIKELVITVAGESPSVGVTDSGGTKWPTSYITRLSEVVIVKVVGVKPDVYKVEVGSMSDTHVVVSGSTSVHFQHGFSIIRPSGISDTVTRPVPEEKSYISIKFKSEGDVRLQTVQILDMDDNILMERPLKLVNKEDQFYTTPEMVVPPNHIFRVAIKSYDYNRKSYLTRMGLTPVKPQEVKIHTVKVMAPVVNIVGSPKIDAEYDKPLQLKCRVSGYPKPSVIWESDNKSAVLSHKVSTVELPYDFVSVLDIRKVTKNATYSCNAVNSEGTSESSIQTKLTSFFKIVAVPKDVTIEYQKEHKILCKADAVPPASVTWYKDNRPLRLDGNMELSAEGSILTIRSMDVYMVGEYLCEARNNVGRKIVPFTVGISGVEPPMIRDDIDRLIAMKHSKADIQCQVIKGHPKPKIEWMFKGAEDEEFISLKETTDAIHFDNVQTTDAGTYRCVAENVVDWVSHEIELTVEYIPSISREFNPSVIANQGDKLILQCATDGVPTPDVTWRHNGAALLNSRYSFFKDGSLRITTTLSDQGVYECEARNVHGVDRITINVDIIVPVEIESPKNSFIEPKVGSPVVLPCQADGTPKPMITWFYRSKDDKIQPRSLPATDASGDLRLPRIQTEQSGTYTCVATNAGGSKSITYEVSVLAPPSIQYTTKQFRAVVGDMQLRIPCVATGNSKPSVTWSNNGYNLASGSEWFDISKDGSLIIKNVDKKSEGSYVCTASNRLGIKPEAFKVVVDEYPRERPSFHSKLFMIEEGTSAIIPCSVPRKKTDRLRWFKNGRMVSDSALEFRNVKQSDSGIYTCRVSFVDKPAQSGSTKVEVGSKPQFAYLDDDKNIPFMKEMMAYMDCTATGTPEPKVKWFHDGKEIGFTGFQYEFEMTNINQKGRYTCVVSNDFATVKQEYVISSSECLLDIKNDFNVNDPLMLTTYDTLPNFESGDGYLHIPKGEMIKLSCPSGFNAIPFTDINVICENDKEFRLDSSGSRYSYSDLKCRSKLRPTSKRTGQRCTYGNSEMVDIGFEIGRRFKKMYHICVDVATQTPIYANMTMQQPLANVIIKRDTEWFNDGLPVDLDSLYDCSYQNSEISAILDKEFHRYDWCCFNRQFLVNPKDVAPGLPQSATYTHLNVAPQWGTCNSKNWDDVEQRVRNLVMSSERPLNVWTGTAHGLQLNDALSEKRDITLNSRRRNIPVPKFFWKVVQDPSASASLAIIHVNVPDLRSSMEAAEYRLCTDVCRETKWMQNRRWRDVDRGYIYCCKLTDFENRFRFHGIFPRHTQLLKDVSFNSDSHYLHAI